MRCTDGVKLGVKESTTKFHHIGAGVGRGAPKLKQTPHGYIHSYEILRVYGELQFVSPVKF